ncbi:hypothetical protein [Dyadobacter pollutisoli]|uniref:SRPBCC family protein n=1 Tax=Dyadobacter pollutisoli TaxID=2910158 RepID=A0A9E8NE35_9BACT|nr:hypothetical protein [Dyadobacter pollutisoli]WAC15055.1 hypothetical protein ON006_14030 [Dyadobacter pollutisoli]
MNFKRPSKTLIALGVPVIYALTLTTIFGLHSWTDILSVMSISFLFCLPAVIGAFTVYLSNEQNVASLPYRIFIPWIPLFSFVVITLFFQIEGWACWVMILPFFMASASLGGLLGGYLKARHNRRNHIHVFVFALLPFLLSPIENMIGTIPGTYRANTTIDIAAPDSVIWRHVTRVSEIPENEDKGWLTRSLGFPRPVRAELNFEGPGASREAIFTNGLIFHETVLKYAHLQKMVFSIKANPYEIPSTTMDKHIVIGGAYFDVLTGTYELEKLGQNRYRLHLYSHFKLNTNFNFYASWWARWIMQDIQNNILQIVKRRAEKGAPLVN